MMMMIIVVSEHREVSNLKMFFFQTSGTIAQI